MKSSCEHDYADLWIFNGSYVMKKAFDGCPFCKPAEEKLACDYDGPPPCPNCDSDTKERIKDIAKGLAEALGKPAEKAQREPEEIAKKVLFSVVRYDSDWCINRKELESNILKAFSEALRAERAGVQAIKDKDKIRDLESKLKVAVEAIKHTIEELEKSRQYENRIAELRFALTRAGLATNDGTPEGGGKL